jgi:hypothetical protein
MDKRSDDIRQDIEYTRASLDEKIDMLQSKANETIDQAKQAFDLKYQVGERPWVALGAAIAAGYVLGSLGNDEPSYSQSTASYDYQQAGYTSGPSTLDKVKSGSADFLAQFDDEIDLLKQAAMITLTSFLRDTVREAVPALAPQLDQLINQRGLGGASSSPSTNSGSGSNSGATYGSTSSATGASYNSGASYNGTSYERNEFGTRSTAPNTSTSYDNNEGGVNNDAIPQMNRYGNPPPTPSRDESDYFTTYQPNENERSVNDDKTRY